MQKVKDFLSVLILIFVLMQAGQAQMRSLSGYFPPSLTKRDKELTAINPTDKIKFASFLDEDETGFVRLHDAGNCSLKSSVVNADEPCPWNIPGKAATYSFRKEKYRSAFFSDLALFKSNFQVVGVNSVGYLIELGDVSLDGDLLQNEGVKKMSALMVAENLEEIKKQFVAAEKGFKIGEFFYKYSLPVKENTTYALRSIAYQGKVYRKVNGFKLNVLEGDKRIDLTLAFRVIRKHEDGSVSILWKELNRKDAPKIVFAKSDKN